MAGHTRNKRVGLAVKVGEIDVAVGIDKHGQTAAYESRRRGRRSDQIIGGRRYIVVVGRDEASSAPRMPSMRPFAARPVSSLVNCTPMPCARAP